MKSTINNKYWFILLISIVTFSVSAQEVEDELQNVTFHAGLQFGTPANMFRKNLGNSSGFGGGLSVVWNPLWKVPEIGIGVSISYMHFGRDLNTIQQNTSDELRIKTAHSIFPLHAIVRYQPVTTRRVRPYFDFLIGTTLFETRTKEDQSALATALVALFDEESGAVVIDKFTHASFNWGGALGIMTDLGEKRKSAFGLKVVAIKGSTASYSGKGITKVVNENIEHAFFRSKTDMFLVQADIVFYF